MRCKNLESSINEELREANQTIFGHNCSDDPNEFRYEISKKKIKSFLSYLYRWKGFTNSAKIPSTYRDYEIKARNWLKGRRLKKYSNTLYADMIQSVLCFAEKVSIARFPGDNERHKKLQPLYHNILIYRFLMHIFQMRLSGGINAEKKLYLISEHAIKCKARVSKAKELMQKYCRNQSASSNFPSHRRQAIDYFGVLRAWLVKLNCFYLLFIKYAGGI